MKWSLNSKVIGGYALALLMVLVIGAVSYRSTSQFMVLSEDRRLTHENVSHLERLLSALKDAETGERGFVIAGKETFLEPYNNAQSAVGEQLGAIQSSPTLALRYGDKLRVLDDAVRDFLRLLKEIIDIRRGDGQGMEKAQEKIVSGTDKRTMDGLRKMVGEIQRQEQEILDKKAQETHDNAWTSLATIAGCTVLAFLLLSLVGVFLARSISRPLNEAINVLTSSASQIATTTTQVAANATETATAVTQTTTTLAEVKQTAAVAVEKAGSVAASAQQTAQVSQTGVRAVEEMIGGINRIREQTDSVAASIVRLSEQSQAIGAIISTVDDLAAQSNLLAVNASIEAAKAGEQGKGFAVVAQEVKTLAEQSKQATSQVRTILNDIQKATGAAVMATEQSSKAVEAGLKQAADAGQSVRTLTESITQSAQAATQIAASTQQQLVGMDQLVQAMENIKQASIQNANSTRQTEQAARNLTALGRQLKSLVSGPEQQ